MRTKLRFAVLARASSTLARAKCAFVGSGHVSAPSAWNPLR
jgi:hypothetical protein